MFVWVGNGVPQFPAVIKEHEEIVQSFYFVWVKISVYPDTISIPDPPTEYEIVGGFAKLASINEEEQSRGKAIT